MTELTPLPPARGSGPISCCGNHRERCRFGHAHGWSVWYCNAKIVRTAVTTICDGCGSICTADEVIYSRTKIDGHRPDHDPRGS